MSAQIFFVLFLSDFGSFAHDNYQMKTIIVACALLLAVNSQLPLLTYYDTQISLESDIHFNSSVVIVKNVVSINAAGGVQLTQDTLFCIQTAHWQFQGKRVIVSVSTSLPNFYEMLKAENTKRAITSIKDIIQTTPYSGIQIQVVSPSSHPVVLGSFIKQLKLALNGGFITVSSRALGVHQGSVEIQLGNLDALVVENNFIWALNKVSGMYIDMYTIHTDGGWYDNLEPSSKDRLIDIVKQWRNMPSSFCEEITRPCSQLTLGQKGIPAEKITLKVNSNPQDYAYIAAVEVATFQQWLFLQGINIGGMGTVSAFDLIDLYRVATAIQTGADSFYGKWHLQREQMCWKNQKQALML